MNPASVLHPARYMRLRNIDPEFSVEYSGVVPVPTWKEVLGDATQQEEIGRGVRLRVATEQTNQSKKTQNSKRNSSNNY